MFPYSSPRHVYEEYQARVNACVLTYQRMTESHFVPRVAVWARWRAWFDRQRSGDTGRPLLTDLST